MVSILLFVILSLLIVICFCRVSAENSCDGRTIIFIGGFHHGGTTVSHFHLLNRANNATTNRKTHEEWPTTKSIRKAACSNVWQVYKHPTNSRSDVQRMKDLRKTLGLPAMKLIFTWRDLPNTVWSLMKRSWRNHEVKDGITSLNRISQRNADQYARSWCEVNHAWWEAPHMNGDGVFAWDLSIFSQTSDTILDLVIPPGSLGGSKKDKSALRRALLSNSSGYNFPVYRTTQANSAVRNPHSIETHID